MPEHSPRITVVNDNPEYLQLMHALLDENSGYDVTTIDGDTIVDIEPIRTSQPDLLIIDLRWRPDGLAGWDILLAVRGDPELGELPIILCTGDVQGLKEHAEAIAQEGRSKALQDRNEQLQEQLVRLTQRTAALEAGASGTGQPIQIKNSMQENPPTAKVKGKIERGDRKAALSN